MKRRALLGTLGPTVAGLLAGCAELTGGQPSPTRQTTTATTTPTTSTISETPECDGAERMGPLYDAVSYEPLDGFDLTVAEESVPKQDALRVTLKNTTQAEQSTGVKDKYDIQRNTDGDWQSVFWWQDEQSQHEAWYASQVDHSPGEGFSWELPLTRAGLGHEITDGVGYLAVCKPIQPGTYRFVYWGIIQDGGGQEKDTGLAVRFTVT